MAQTMTRSKVQNISKPDLEQTAAQSLDAMMQTSSSTAGQSVADLEPTTDELERKKKKARKLHQTEASPQTARYKAMPAKTDPHSAERRCTAKKKREGALKRKPHSAGRLSSTSKEGNLIQQTIRIAKQKFRSVGRSRVQCKREASRIRRAITADRSANDIAKQVTMTREREKVIRTREEK